MSHLKYHTGNNDFNVSINLVIPYSISAQYIRAFNSITANYKCDMDYTNTPTGSTTLLSNESEWIAMIITSEHLNEIELLLVIAKVHRTRVRIVKYASHQTVEEYLKGLQLKLQQHL